MQSETLRRRRAMSPGRSAPHRQENPSRVTKGGTQKLCAASVLEIETGLIADRGSIRDIPTADEWRRKKQICKARIAAAHPGRATQSRPALGSYSGLRTGQQRASTYILIAMRKLHGYP